VQVKQRTTLQKLDPGIKLLMRGCSPISVGGCVRGWAGQRDVRRGWQTSEDQAAERSGGAPTPTSENWARDQEVQYRGEEVAA
jgi:hypothetical protein